MPPMKKVKLKARIRRNMLDKLAGTCYLDEDSGLVNQLNSRNRSALVGIQREDGVYTVIGESSIYYSTTSGVEGEIAIGGFLAILRKNALSLGKTAPHEFVALNEREAIWVMNIQVMNALWNTLLLLYGASVQGLPKPTS
jgi:hypothetical protein